MPVKLRCLINLIGMAVASDLNDINETMVVVSHRRC